jgi:hypothetical protein
MVELYSYDKYEGYHLYVECIELEEGVILYEGIAQQNGTTMLTSKSVSSGDNAEKSLKRQIDKERGNCHERNNQR